MRAVSTNELERLRPLNEGNTGFETISTISLDDHSITAFYDEGTDLFTVDVHGARKVLARYEQYNGIQAIQVLMSEVDKARGRQ